MDLEDAVEQGMVEDAERMIDRMIPREGRSMFNDPESQALFGLGQADLDAAGSAAFGQSDLDAAGSAAFGQSDLDSGGSNAFLGSIDLDQSGSAAFGKLKIGGAMKRIGRILLMKKGAARTALKKVGVAHKQVANAAKQAFQMAKVTINPFQKAKLAKQAKSAAKRANALMKQGQALAKEAVAPTITREEAKAAVLPAVKTLAKSVASAGKKAINWQAATVRPWGSRQDVQDFGIRPGQPGQMRPPSHFIPTGSRMYSGDASWKNFSEKLMAANVAAQIIGDKGGAVSGFLSMGDMDTVTQDSEAGDILDAWDSSEMFEDTLL